MILDDSAIKVVKETIKDWEVYTKDPEKYKDHSCRLCEYFNCQECPTKLLLELTNCSREHCTDIPVFDDFEVAFISQEWGKAKRHAKEIVKLLKGLIGEKKKSSHVWVVEERFEGDWIASQTFYFRS